MRDRLHFASESGIAELHQADTAVAEARDLEARAIRGRDEAQARLADERATDAFATHLVSVLDHGEALGLQEGHCPLCDAARTNEEFAAAIQGARRRLDTRGERLSAMIKQLEEANAAVSAAAVTLGEAIKRQQELTERVALIEGTLLEATEIFSSNGFDAERDNPPVAREALLRRQEQTASLEQALFILEASAAHDRVASLEAKVAQLRSLVEEETTRLLDAEKAVETARQIDNAAKVVANQVLTEQFDTVMPLLKELYRRLRPHADWQEIETDFGGRIRASLNFTVGDGKNPQFLFSSGQRRAAGLAFLLSIHLSRPWCRLRSLLLDDPVQHIDDYRALNLVEVLSAVRRTGRQVIVAVEDPALADLLSRRLRSSGAEGGRRFDLATGNDGASCVERALEIFPSRAGRADTRSSFVSP
ncbi:MAG: hypothetical protein NVV62_08245 [Terricaulis sp.]|nr:hypothetical protein [Terricaulis sp.]